MNVKGIMPSVGAKFTVQKNETKKVFVEKPDAFEKQTKEEKKSFKTKAKEFFNKAKNCIAIVIASSLSALAVFATMKVKNNKIKEECEKIQKKFDEIVLPEDFQEKIDEKLSKLNATKLSYSPTTRIEVQDYKWGKTKDEPEFILTGKHKRTTLRSDAKELNYPTFKEGKTYSFEFPTSSEIKITHEHNKIAPQERTLTTISESYADSLVWNNDKIARDLMQNFYDGHGQTLDGVKFDITPTNDGKYKVKIQGKSTFSPDKAILLGESSKKNNDKAAGNYGEGLKMVVLKLLREKGADEVNIAADNWNVNWKFEDSGFGKKVLAYKLDEIPPVNGNFIEFNTDNVDFIKAMINSFDKFYHYNNPAFKCPNFENDIIGINLIDKKEKGKIFIAGQAFEVDGDYDGLKGMNIYIKKKPPLSHNGTYIFDPSRDRTSLNKDNLEALGSWITSKENMKKEEVVELIHALEDYWDIGTRHSMFKHNTKGTSFINGLFKGAYDRDDLKIKFPDEKYVTDTLFVSSSLADMYANAGYKLCSSYFHLMGMPSLEDLVEETRKHKPLEPTGSEKNKILILKEAIQLLAPVLKEDDMFSDEELDTKIFIYDRKSNNEDDAYKNVTGEAIIESKKSLGFWLDRTAMKNENFSNMLATSLHELTHKFGGDSSEIFSYKLTDVMEKVFSAINNNPNLAVQLKVLEQAWEAQK
ncbi:MAG: hypothetical protein IJY61_06455 [Candidatus Gastranaerophilales bacterium]|nr:hypothetical protein [Candidatus Gastranaerophilales bacterium]